MMPKETKNLLGATCPSMLSPSWVITVDVFTSKQTQKRNFVHILAAKKTKLRRKM